MSHLHPFVNLNGVICLIHAYYHKEQVEEGNLNLMIDMEITKISKVNNCIYMHESRNIKEIAKLRGSEDLWEVAKLHNNEALFPMVQILHLFISSFFFFGKINHFFRCKQDLLDVKYLSPTNLRDWCGRNTRRRDIFDAIPASLFDLVDKCLMVNPRQRISADEALRHDFFAPCHEAFRKHRRGPGPAVSKLGNESDDKYRNH